MKREGGGEGVVISHPSEMLEQAGNPMRHSNPKENHLRTRFLLKITVFWEVIPVL
jgi:hypothetical protein